jgi:hypothetical protein
VTVVRVQPMYCFGSVLFQNALKSGGLASENPEWENRDTSHFTEETLQ